MTLKWAIFLLVGTLAVVACNSTSEPTTQPSATASAVADTIAPTAVPTSTQVQAPPTSTSTPVADSTPSGVSEVSASEPTTTPSGLQYTDLVVGTGAVASAGMTAVVHYTGWLLDGTKFDSSVDRGQPFEFPLGAGRVIKGWDEGVAGMNVGGKRELIIPPELAYGSLGAGELIPPNATLKFEVELLDLK